jgi:hypothetical protein
MKAGEGGVGRWKNNIISRILRNETEERTRWWCQFHLLLVKLTFYYTWLSLLQGTSL